MAAPRSVAARAAQRPPASGAADPDPPCRVLVVEDQAHEATHAASWYATVASALVEDGHAVEVLTRRGPMPGYDPPLPSALTTRVYPVPLRVLADLGDRVKTTSERAARFATLPRLAGRALTEVAAGLAARHGARRVARHLPGPGELVVLVTSMSSDARWLSLLAPRHGCWLVTEWVAPPEAFGSRSALTPVRAALQALGRRRQARRRRAGGRFVLATASPTVHDGWLAVAPWLDPLRIESATRVPRQRLDGAEARRALGLPADRPVALFFGVNHDRKDADTVWRAFARPDPPAHLLSAGTGMRASLESFRARHPHVDVSAITVVEGFLTDHQMVQCFSAADCSIVSTIPESHHDSGTFMDSIAVGTPVCCSEPGIPADLVRAHGLGSTYPSGDSEALARAVLATVPVGLDAGRQAGFLARFDHGAELRRVLRHARGLPEPSAPGDAPAAPVLDLPPGPLSPERPAARGVPGAARRNGPAPLAPR